MGSSSAAIGAPMPALFTSTSRWPSSAMASATSRSQSASTEHVAGHRHEPLAELGGERLEPVGAPGRRHDRGAGGVQHPGEAVAEPARRAGDDGDPPVEAERGGEVDGRSCLRSCPEPTVTAVKVRIGYGLGTRASSDPDRFAALVTGLEARRFDSLWLSERVTGDCPDPIVGLGVAAGLTTKIKFGFSVLVVPGRNPMLLAKELATLDRLSRGRLLPAFGLGAPDPGEHQAFGVERGDRAKIFNEVLPLLRRFWAGEIVDHDGDVLPLRGRRGAAAPAPGAARHLARRHRAVGAAALRPAGRRLAAVVLHPRGRAGRASSSSRRTPPEHDREIDPEHFGALIPYTDGPIPDIVAAGVAQRRPGRRPEPDDRVRPRRPAAR